MALGPPPSEIFSSSLRRRVTSSAMARMFFSNRCEVGSMVVRSRLSGASEAGLARSGMGRLRESFYATTTYIQPQLFRYLCYLDQLADRNAPSKKLNSC